MEYVVDNGIVYIPIKNLRNCYCYHIAVVQLLHTSPTLGSCLRVTGDRYADMMLGPLLTYNQINIKNKDQVFEAMIKAYEMLDRHVKVHGYWSYVLLYDYIMPIIHHFWTDQFPQICSELNIDQFHLRQPPISVKAVMRSNPFVEWRPCIDEWYREMFEDPFDYRPAGFKGGIIEVMPDANSSDGGHGLFILKTQDKFIVFDDATVVDLFEHYVHERSGFISRIAIQNIDAENASRLQSLWGDNVLTRRVNNRWEAESSSTKMKLIPTAFMLLRQQGSLMSNQMSGGEPQVNLNAPAPNPEVKKWKTIAIVFISLFVVSIIGIVIEIIVTLKKRQGYKCPCKNRR